MTRVLIVGCGITGAVTSSLLKFSLSSNSSVIVWDKAKYAGGRLNTNGYSKNGVLSSVDLGAQYISPSPQEYSSHSTFYSELESDGLLQALSCRVEGDLRNYDAGTKHFVAPHGMRSLVEHYLSKSGADVHLSHTLSDLKVEAGRFIASTLEKDCDTFDVVVLTMPVPQVLQVSGTLQTLLAKEPGKQKDLQQVEFSSRYALGVYLQEGARPGVDWGAKYFDDPVIRYIAVDSAMRNIAIEHVKRESLVVHSTVGFGLETINSSRDAVCANVILPRLRQLLPNLPPAAFIKMHRWRYSQVYKAYPGSPGAVVLNASPLLVLGGDSFTYSKFDGCLTSALKIVELIHSSL